MDIAVIIFGACLFVFGGFVLGYAVSDLGRSGLKRENQRLNDELRRLTDRDSKGRFVKRERK
jgi:hypothetical protein